MKILLYYHAGSRNHGCEAIVRTICEIFNKDQIILYSFDSESDRQFGLGDIATLKQCLPKKKSYSIKERIQIRLGHYQEGQECYREMLDEQNIDWAFAIGGDNYCYKGQPEELAYINREFKKRGVKTALVGCSIDEDVIAKKEVQRDLAVYDIIVARESLTYTNLKIVGLFNVLMYPDTAFALNKKYSSVQELRDDVKYIGINISPLIMKNESKENILIRSYLHLIRYILENTCYHIMLIPHVCVAWDNDLDAIEQICGNLDANDRIHVLSELGCENLKYYISKCSYVICARTHVSIAAYSLGIPTLVVGYSIKSKGIAKDLFGEFDKYVLSAGHINEEEKITTQFLKMMKEEEKIRRQLIISANEYKTKLNSLRNVFLNVNMNE